MEVSVKNEIRPEAVRPKGVISKSEFVVLPRNRRAYLLAKLYIARDRVASKVSYTERLFPCLNYIKKLRDDELSLMYNYLSDFTHEGLRIWEVLPKARQYDQRRRIEQKPHTKDYEAFSLEMIKELLEG